jgi:transposase
MDSWEQTGIAGLQIAFGRGRKAAIQLSDTALVAQIKQELQLNPQRLAQVGAQISKSTGLSLSKGQLKRFIKKS